MYRRLLVPLDGSRLAESSCRRRAIGPGRSGDPDLLHVLEREAPATVHGERHLRAQDEAETYLQGVAARLQTQASAWRPIRTKCPRVMSAGVSRNTM